MEHETSFLYAFPQKVPLHWIQFCSIAQKWTASITYSKNENGSLESQIFKF